MAFRRDWKYVMKYFIGQGCANPGSLSLMQLILYGGASYKWALSMELFSCRSYGAQNCVSQFFKILWTPDGGCVIYTPACAQHKIEVLNHPVSKSWTLSLIKAEKGIKSLIGINILALQICNYPQSLCRWYRKEHIVACGFTDIDVRLVLNAQNQETIKESPPSKLSTDQEEHIYHRERGSFEVLTEQSQETNSENLS